MATINKEEYPIKDREGYIRGLSEIVKKPADETPYPDTLEKAIDLYYYSYGNGEGEFEHLSLEKFRDIVHTFVNDYGNKVTEWNEEDEKMFQSIKHDLQFPGVNYYKESINEKIDWLEKIKKNIINIKR